MNKFGTEKSYWNSASATKKLVQVYTEQKSLVTEVLIFIGRRHVICVFRMVT